MQLIHEVSGQPDIKLVIITGLSGSGKSVALKVLEDAGMEERFVSWNTGDQTAGYVFATPSKAREVIKLLDLDQGE